MNNRNWFQHCVFSLLVLVILAIGSMTLPGVHKLLFEKGGIVILLVILAYQFVSPDSKNNHHGNDHPFSPFFGNDSDDDD